jgi:hypothetical protein
MTGRTFAASTIVPIAIARRRYQKYEMTSRQRNSRGSWIESGLILALAGILGLYIE